MNPGDWERVKDLYEQACALPSSARLAFARGSADGAVQRELLRLLEFDPDSTAAIDRPVQGSNVIQLLATGSFTVLQPGQLLINRFRIVRLAGRGGMGEVYEAEDTQLRQRVAIKTIRADLSGDDRVIERFRREIALCRQIAHPNVCRLFELHESERGRFFLTMEYLDGGTLADLLQREGPLTLTQAIPLIEQMTAGLAAAHAAGVVHRDFKSSNIFLTTDRSGQRRVVITDFGLARAVDPVTDQANQTTTGWGAGTPAYMAPEQLEGQPAGPAADLYALGVVMYEMGTGQPPYAGDSPLQVAVRKVKEPPPPPRALNAQIDPKWESAILRCLEIDPRDRYASAADVAPSLARLPLVRIPARRMRRWAAWTAAGLAGAAAIAWGTLNLAPSSEAEPPVAVATWYRDGVSALQEGSLATAQRAFEKTVAGAPNWPEGHARLAQVFDEMDQPDRARQAVLKAIQLQPRWLGRSRLVEAVQALLARDFSTAQAAFRTIAGSQPGRRPAAAIDLARCLDRADRPAESVVVLDQLLKDVPDHPTAHLNRAVLGIRSSAPERTVEAGFENALKGYQPLNRVEALAETYFQQSLWRMQQRRIPEAMDLARASLNGARNANSPWTEVKALFHLARLTNETGGAAAEYESLRERAMSLARQEKLWASLLNGQIDLGIQQFSQDQLEPALIQFRSTRESAQQYEAPRAAARASYWTGLTLQRLKRLTDAEASLEVARAFWRQNGFNRERLRTELVLAQVWRIQGRDEQARPVAQRVIDQVGQFGDHNLISLAYTREANFLMNRGQYPRALEIARLLLKEAESTGFVNEINTAELLIARALLNLGDWDQLAAALGRMERFTAPRDVVDLRLLRAGFLLERGERAAALREYREVEKFVEEKKLQRFRPYLTLSLCIASVQAETPERARPQCSPLREPTEDKEIEAARHFALADFHLAAGEFPAARNYADAAYRFYQSKNHLDNSLYALLIRSQAECRSGLVQQCREGRRQADSVFQAIRSEWGPALADRYLNRMMYKARWDEIRRN